MHGIMGRWEVSLNRFVKSQSSMVLMTANSDYDVSVEWYSSDPESYTDWGIDEYFIVPRSLAEAYRTARATVEYLEANIEAHRLKSGHRKHIRK